MANVFNFYSDADCQTSVMKPSAGSVYIPTDSPYSTINGWTERQGNIYSAYINRKAGIIISANSIFDARFTTSKIYDTNPVITDGNTKNAFFVSANNNYSGTDASYYLQIIANMASATECDITVRFGAYTTQNQVYHTDGSPSGVVTAIIPNVTASQFAGVRIATCNISDTDFIMIAAGVSDNGELSPNASAVILIDRGYFKTNIPKPYTGPVSKESAESAFIGSRSKESVLPRDLSISPNPYGFNRNGVYLCKCDRDSYNKITSKIYNGLSGNYLNALGQVVSGVIVGNSRRPRDEVQTMVNGVLCCHAVPVLGGFPSTGSVAMTSICGYSMFAPDEMTLQTVDPIQHETITTGIIPRQTGNYLDFAPYTNVSLSIPILGTVQIDPSAILGRSLSLHFGMDVFAGVLSCDVSIIEPDGTSWIYTTLQANCGTDMQIMGSGANDNPILKLANAMTDGMQAPLAGIFSAYDGLQTCSYSTPINRISHTGANLLLSPYAIYLTVTTPNNSNAEDFWSLAGIPSHMSGNVGSFTGYTVFEHVDLSGVSGATDSELSEIENALRGGVWL